MKITKARLKEIIREELAAEGSREDMMMPAIPMDAAEEEEADLDFVGILDNAIAALASKPELANQLELLKQQIVPASEYDAEEDRPRPAIGAPSVPGVMGFEEGFED